MEYSRYLYTISKQLKMSLDNKVAQHRGSREGNYPMELEGQAKPHCGWNEISGGN